MEKTSQYQLNQWAAEDRILREDFNRDNANVEAGLVALGERVTAEETARQAAVSAEQNAREQAVTAEQTARAQAISAAQSQLESAKADKTALAELAARVDAMPFVRLRSITTSTAVNQIDVDMSGIDLRQYAFLLVAPQLFCGESDIQVRVNGEANYWYYRDNSTRNYLVSFISVSEEYNYSLKLMGLGESINAVGEYIGGRGYGGVTYGHMSENSGSTSSTLQTLNFLGEDGAVIAAGGKITIYGVRL